MSPDMQNIVNYLIPAYLLIWLIIFAFVWSIRSRQRNLQKDLDALKKVIEKKQGGDQAG
jgi:CcmD family protein